MDASHTIFQEPFPVALEFEEVDTPEHYGNWYDGRDLGDTMEVWRVHGELKEKDYGLVSDPYGMEDSPDAEVISSGINSKGPSSVALGRQGNLFLWGFCAPPEEMTPSARKVFLNTLWYMRGFHGQRPLLKRKAQHRDWAYQYATYLERDRLTEYGRKKFSRELLEASGGETAAMQELLRAKEDWLRLVDGAWHVDGDAAAIGPGNRDIALLEACITRLEQGEDEERARRVLRRYTGLEHGGAAAWRSWLDTHRDRLYFSDTGGYRWHVAPEGYATPGGGSR